MAVISGNQEFAYAYTLQANLKTLTFTTDKLVNGTHIFRAFTVDNLGNRMQAMEDLSIVISGFPAAITDLAVTYDEGTGKATITWTESPDADHYEVYGNGGDASLPAPNFQSGLIDGSVSGDSYTTGVLSNGTWWFGVRVVDGDGLREENLMRVGPIVVPGSANVPDDPGIPGDEDQDAERFSRIEFERVSIGKLTLSFYYFGNDIATHFHVYVGIGEEPDFDASPRYEFDRTTVGFLQEYTTEDQLHEFEDTTVYIAVKAASASNVESLAEDVYQIDIDGVPPIAPINLEIEATT